jgi:hypothetical protein
MYRHKCHFKVKWIVTNLIGVFRLWVFILIFRKLRSWLQDFLCEETLTVIANWPVESLGICIDTLPHDVSIEREPEVDG